VKPMNYQQALASGYQEFWGKTVSRSWGQSWIWDRDDMCEDVKPFAYEFIPIPTAEQLLGAVNGKCQACTDLSSRIVVIGDPVLEPGDEVIILRKLQPPKEVEQPIKEVAR